MREPPEVIVVGGGAAGAAAACHLAANGRAVTLFERELGAHDKICGEFLSREAQADLARLGVDPVALGAAPIHTVRLVHRRMVAEAALPFRALGLSRRVLDEALLARAASLGARIERGRTVREVGPGPTTTVDGQTIPAAALFLATGKHDLRQLRRTPARPPEDLVGFKMHYRLRPGPRLQLRGAVEVLLFRGGYAGLQLIEHDRANLCLLVHRDRLAEGGGWAGLVDGLRAESSHLDATLQGAAELFARPLTISRVPYGFVHRPGPADIAGVFRLGDQLGVIPSFSGDGVSIALHTARRAVEAHLEGSSSAAYHARVRRELGGQIGRAGVCYAVGRQAPAGVVLAARLWPGLLRTLARATRIREAPPHRRLPEGQGASAWP